MGWIVYGWNSWGGWVARFSAPIQTSPGAHTVSYTVGTGPFPGVKWQGHVIYHRPPFSAEVKERAEILINSMSLPSWQVARWTLALVLIKRLKACSVLSCTHFDIWYWISKGSCGSKRHCLLQCEISMTAICIFMSTRLKLCMSGVFFEFHPGFQFWDIANKRSGPGYQQDVLFFTGQTSDKLSFLNTLMLTHVTQSTVFSWTWQ
jgi:hypothetical protein